MKETLYRGTPVSRGIAIGAAYRYRPAVYVVRQGDCAAGGAAAERARFELARQAAIAELKRTRASFPESAAGQAMIFAAHEELLNDEEVLEAIYEGVDVEHRNAEYAVSEAFEAFIALLSGVQDATIASRTADLWDVRNRLLRLLSGGEEKNLSRLPGPVIIVAHDLLPSDTATMDRENVLGIITEVGAAASHSAIIAKSMNIPAVLGVADALELVQDGEALILDAVEGRVLRSPNEATLASYRARAEEFRAQRTLAARYLNLEARTSDGVRLEIGLNIGSDAPDEHYRHADFVGLFRTEFLYMESDHLPSEQEQFEAYRRVLLLAEGKPVTLRTLDIGGDKKLPYLALPEEENPFLGRRALRLCLDEEDIFRSQLRAAYRASVFGRLQIMFPMVGSLDDIARAKAAALSAREELAAEGVAMGEVPIGIMIEIPAIAVIADLAAEAVDFASIGTNDLCQYLCAADRMNAAAARYYQSFSPAMLRTLRHVIDAFDAAGKPLSICGEMGGDPDAVLLLAGMGLKKLSMSGSAIAEVKAALAAHSSGELKTLAAQALRCGTEEEVRALVRRMR